MTSTEKGRVAELIALTAFMTNNHTVMEPLSAETFDFAAINKETNEYIRVQTKMLAKRERGGIEYYVCKGRRNNGEPYALGDVDYFAGVVGNKVYVIRNLAQSEYWCKVSEAEERWRHLEINF